MPKNLLFISISSPHKSGPESIQVSRYLSSLSNHFNIEFITTKPSNYGWTKTNPKGLEFLKKSTNKIIELKSFDNKLFSKLKSFLPERVKFPDRNFHFHLGFKKIIKKISNDPDIIYSRSGSLSATILAYKLSMHYQAPWILHLSDPWVDSPFMRTSSEQHIIWEKKCFSKAKAITVTTENYKNLLLKKYPEHQNKFFTSYNVFAQHTYSSTTLGTEFKMAYTGNFYGNRTPKILLESLKISYATSPTLFKNVKLFFYGNMDDNITDMINSYSLPFVIIKGPVKQNEVSNLIINSTIVINIEEPFSTPFDSLFLPSKVIDYIASQKYILSISSKNSPAFKIINNRYGKAFDFNEENKIAKFIEKLIVEFNAQNSFFFKVKEEPIEYSKEYQVEKLITIIDSVTN